MNNYIAEILPQEWKFWEASQAAQAGGLTFGEEPPEHLAFNASKTWLYELHWTEGRETLLFEGIHKVLFPWAPEQNQWLHESLGQTYMLILENLLGRDLVGMTVVHCGDKDTDIRGIGKYSLAWVLLEAKLLVSRTGPPNSLYAAMVECLKPKTDMTGTQPSWSADRLPKVFISPQTPLNKYLDMTLPTRGPRPRSIYQWAGTRPSHYEAHMSLLTWLTHQVEDTRNKKNMILQPGKLSLQMKVWI